MYSDDPGLVHFLQTFMEGLTLGMDVTIMNSFDGKILNRVKAAFDRGDMATCFAEQVIIIELHLNLPWNLVY